MENLKYPIGREHKPTQFSSEAIQNWIQIIDQFPQELGAVIEDMDTDHLTTSYRPNGWTGAQVIHHLADSHMNGYIRFKLALTEDNPTIKPYLEKKWAELEDSKSMNIFNSLAIIKGVHSRWTDVLTSMMESDFQRTLIHPEMEGRQYLYQYLSSYAWHSQHHLAHLKNILDQNIR